MDKLERFPHCAEQLLVAGNIHIDYVRPYGKPDYGRPFVAFVEQDVVTVGIILDRMQKRILQGIFFEFGEPVFERLAVVSRHDLVIEQLVRGERPGRFRIFGATPDHGFAERQRHRIHPGLIRNERFIADLRRSILSF